jgi:hypothetical protein
MDPTRSPLDGAKSIPNALQLSCKRGSVFERHGFGRQDDAVVVGPAVLPNVFIGVTESTLIISGQFREQGDDVAGVPPATEDDLGKRSGFVQHDVPL